ncbi:hypothetical protein SDC9_60953 [bioreactor metagenome]|uniref:Uncharacterized protein n=1 Tax=bioreactor metagenome TaxID=1076179 RepID=A0A644XER9_9ZZZZ
MHADQTTYAELLAAAGIVEFITLLYLALVDTDVGKLTILTILKLECKDDRGEIVVGREDNFLFILVQIESFVDNIGRVGQVADNGIKQGLDTLVLVCRTHQDGDQLKTDGSLTNRLAQQLLSHIVLEHGFHQLIGAHGNTVKQLFALGLCFCKQLSGNLSLTNLVHVWTCIKVESLHADQVNDTLKAFFKPDGNLHQHCIQAELIHKLLLDAIRICTGSVALVDKSDAGNMVALHLPVNRD